MSKRRVLLTGAAGGVAQLLLPGLVDSYDLVLTDRRPVPGGVTGDLADPAFLAKVTEGVDAIVHLAANANPQATWDELRIPNVEVVASLLATGVSRIVLASSGHAMGQYVTNARVPVDPDWPVAPCCAYGATKGFAEALGQAHAYRTATSVVSLRLGATSAEPLATSALGGWLGPADLRQLVLCALEADVRYEVCPGVSANTRSEWDVRNAIGYQPTLDSEMYADGVPVDESWGLCR
ncbi:NAD-dependent epimerase/dehydratase family protein [Actinopolymorpha alba]|uniref:NAD-dependent epimerase/dehydratase family protein n=1 Tax=Actinopolymorpha alba TaxID=533267 RepID=UPI00037B6A39|nr:NAD(P)-dependent oxidoreductase [Actinopolymorpha alba]